MVILDKENISDYIKNNLASRLDFINKCEVIDIAPVGGGLVSYVYRATVDGRNIYIKQAIPGNLDKLKNILKDLPADLFILLNDDRQYAEVKALKIFKDALQNDFTPDVYYHDTENKVLVLSEVCPGGRSFAETMNHEINLKVAETLGKNIALLCNHTYGKIGKLRDDELEGEIRGVKYKYEIGNVWDKIKDEDKRKSAQNRAKQFIDESLKIYKVLVHGDYYERNILTNGEHCATVDLEEGHLGDPVEDIGKLSASYCLRIIYFEKIKEDAFNALLKLLEAFFANLKIPENRNDMERRLKIMMAGVILFRVDGLSSKWMPWTDMENKKNLARDLSLNLILGANNTIVDILTDFYKN